MIDPQHILVGAPQILVRAPNWAGDVVMATPGFRALRAAQPRAQIVLHARAELLPLVAGAPWFDAVLPLRSHHRGVGALLREGLALRSRRFDLGICLPDSFAAALLMRCAGVRRVVGYRTQGRRALLDFAVEPPAGLVARERHVLGLVEAIGCASRGTHLELFVTAREEEAARTLLAKHQIEGGPAARRARAGRFVRILEAVARRVLRGGRRCARRRRGARGGARLAGRGAARAARGRGDARAGGGVGGRTRPRNA